MFSFLKKKFQYFEIKNKFLNKDEGLQTFFIFSIII